MKVAKQQILKLRRPFGGRGGKTSKIGKTKTNFRRNGGAEWVFRIKEVQFKKKLSVVRRSAKSLNINEYTFHLKPNIPIQLQPFY